jgi:hypothetical protein
MLQFFQNIFAKKLAVFCPNCCYIVFAKQFDHNIGFEKKAIFSQKVVINMYIALTPGLKDLRSETFDRMGGGAVVIRVMKNKQKN